ncbi:predicted protein, partial [Brucella abortus bv. 5 str. B3196]
LELAACVTGVDTDIAAGPREGVNRSSSRGGRFRNNHVGSHSGRGEHSGDGRQNYGLHFKPLGKLDKAYLITFGEKVCHFYATSRCNADLREKITIGHF